MNGNNYLISTGPYKRGHTENIPGIWNLQSSLELNSGANLSLAADDNVSEAEKKKQRRWRRRPSCGQNDNLRSRTTADDSYLQIPIGPTMDDATELSG